MRLNVSSMMERLQDQTASDILDLQQRPVASPSRPSDHLVPPHPNDVVPHPPDHLVPTHPNDVVPPPPDHLVPPHPNDVVPRPPDHLVPPHPDEVLGCV
ncbi:hypothetical protein H257_18167 [Aphanomyces astaci]|uniref:Uncharacterized protein n=1 Tax=Aphanomyces astaci TaxID=112090 RepID=W4FC52_APHAT|nr:hypothetical protein H257_18167 [Aphanomyces astaci]ETV65042.1 hypothetical protein H257_18167 [Aphanomyces astaci]|eukprot:XP_009845478.1 hypothetical protein H257_18167 [Aphanomyces astaci]